VIGLVAVLAVALGISSQSGAWVSVGNRSSETIAVSAVRLQGGERVLSQHQLKPGDVRVLPLFGGERDAPHNALGIRAEDPAGSARPATLVLTRGQVAALDEGRAEVRVWKRGRAFIVVFNWR